MASDFLDECKKGLNIAVENTDMDPVLKQKINAVKMFMKNAGVPVDQINSELGIGVVVMGVTDLWNVESGNIKFSPAFFTLVSQMAVG